MYELFNILLADMVEKKEYDKVLSNMLAILLRDGGHYEQKQGTVKAVMKAIQDFHDLRDL